MFTLSKLVGAVATPLSLVVIGGVLALALLWTRYARWGRRLAVAVLAALYLLSWEPFAGRLLAPLEQRYPALTDPGALEAEAALGPIVVLGHAHRLDARTPVTGQVSPESMARLLEGVRLQRALPGRALYLTGGSPRGATPHSAVQERLIEAVGLEAGRVRTFSDPRNTAEEARAVAQALEGEAAGRPIVVTEASHMPRAMALFRGQGLDPVPAPTRHRVREREAPADRYPGEILQPTGYALRMSERAFHEYLGLAYAYLSGQAGR